MHKILTSLTVSSALLLTFACSGGDEGSALAGADEGLGAEGQLPPYTESEVLALLAEAGVVPRTYDELVQEHEAKLNGVLSATEERTLREALSGEGEALSFQGRIVFMNDIMLDADQLLSDIAQVDKAQVCIAVGNFEGCNGYVANSYTKNDGDGNSGTLSFRRPDVARTTFIVVADGALTFFNALVQETNRIEELNPPGDCLGSGSFVPIKKSQYDAMDGIARAMSFTVVASIGSGVCGANKGCAGLPGNANVLVSFFPNTVESRTGFGQSIPTLGMNSDFFPTDNAEFRAVLRHELLHLMGRSHRMANGDRRVALVPGTTANASSLMEVDGEVFRTKDFSTDDIKAIKTLYSDHPNRANDSCPWTSSFRSFTALP